MLSRWLLTSTFFVQFKAVKIIFKKYGCYFMVINGNKLKHRPGGSLCFTFKSQIYFRGCII